MKNRITAVTGATGFVGQNLIRHLLEKNYYVKALFEIGKEELLASLDVEKIQIDVLDIESLKTAFKDVDVVFHLASMISIEGDLQGKIWQINVMGAANVADAALFCLVKKVVYMSSIHAYDLYSTEDFINEESPRAAKGKNFAYDASKALGELEMLKRIEKGLEVIIVNPAGIIGPYDMAPSRIGHLLLGLIKEKWALVIRGEFNWVDSRDVAIGTLLAYEKGRSGENYILSGHYVSLMQMSEHLSDIAGSRKPFMEIPYFFALLIVPFAKLFYLIKGGHKIFTYEAVRTLQVKKSISSLKAERELGYTSRPFKQTMVGLYHWFLENGYVDIRKKNDD